MKQKIVKKSIMLKGTYTLSSVLTSESNEKNENKKLQNLDPSSLNYELVGSI